MPLFEFHCHECNQQFEMLIRSGETPACPECHSQRVEKLLSAHAAHAGRDVRLPVTSSCPPADAPPCGPGCCRLG